ncbi:MAG: hypothetical protein AB7Q29_10490 [Vicinamibacterales bacterium]
MKLTHPFAAALLAALVVFPACGGSTSEQTDRNGSTAGEMQDGAEAVQKSAENMAKGFEAMAKGLSGGGDMKAVEPVGFTQLQAALPEIGGWERESPTGERMTSPFAYSQASVTFRKGDASIDEKILDSGFNQLLFAPFAMFLASGYEKESSNGFERSVTIDGNPGWEKWDSANKSAELNVVVEKRFLVQIEGNNLEDVKVLRTVLEQTDLKTLASLH